MSDCVGEQEKPYVNGELPIEIEAQFEIGNFACAPFGSYANKRIDAFLKSRPQSWWGVSKAEAKSFQEIIDSHRAQSCDLDDEFIQYKDLQTDSPYVPGELPVEIETQFEAGNFACVSFENPASNRIQAFLESKPDSWWGVSQTEAKTHQDFINQFRSYSCCGINCFQDDDLAIDTPGLK
mgnify:CR=1 FL=1